MPFRFKKSGINGLVLISPRVFEDWRGSFSESYKLSEFKKNGIGYRFNQDNHSTSGKGVLRGLHYQLKPKEQGKLITVINGEIFDVAVDIRRGSASYCSWFGKTLSAENGLMLFIPPGFAHGFVALKSNTEVVYKTTKEYSECHERGISWDDPDIGIKWPLKNPRLSERDLKLPRLKDADNNF